MKKILCVLILFTLHTACYADLQEIHCKHFIYGYPLGTPATNDMIIRDIYALSSNDQTKFADWVCYRLDRETVEGEANTKRKWKADPWLEDEETLEPPDYKGANAALKTDRGHQAPLASFKGTKNWHETNYLSNITPQKANLNQGAWKNLEDSVRDLVKKGREVWVMTGPLYEENETSMPKADEPHKVPSGYWKIVVTKNPEIKIAAFVMDQDTPRNSKVISHIVTVDDVEQKSGLDFLWELPDDKENNLESQDCKAWAESWVRK